MGEGQPADPELADDCGAAEHRFDFKEAPATVKSSISLTGEQYAFARALVEASRYLSVRAMLQQGRDLLRRRMDAEELETAALRKLLLRRRNGEFKSAREMDRRFAGMVAD
ncbi:MAG: type II toxin-antitoxin system ParD family antitoxin [Albidovulum sp.]|nr:type II toxin-antitoxin system ParD family antitoxin [Albidovulum sp.]